MKKNLLSIVGTAALVLVLGSCAYDPYYGGGTTRSSVSVGYGYGHGYGGNSFSTSYFWSTGDSRWGYDPYSRAYYDHHRRAYYDPYLYGYYPVGYRPPILVGVPHPVGYRQGWCPPPSRVTNVTVVNYRDRESAYRNTNHNWARNVRQDSSHRTSPPARNTGFTPAATSNPRNQWEGRGSNTGRQGGNANWQNRTPVPPQASGSPMQNRQNFDRNTGDRRGFGVPDAAPRTQPGNRGNANWPAQQSRQPAQQTRQPAQPSRQPAFGGPDRNRFEGGGRARPQPAPAPAPAMPNPGMNRQRDGGDRSMPAPPPPPAPNVAPNFAGPAPGAGGPPADRRGGNGEFERRGRR